MDAWVDPSHEGKLVVGFRRAKFRSGTKIKGRKYNTCSRGFERIVGMFKQEFESILEHIRMVWPLNYIALCGTANRVS